MAQITVNNFAALKSAAQDVNIDYIYLDADITLATGGILLNKNKPSLVIDGINPLDPLGTVHSITDLNDNYHSNAIRVAADVGSYHLTLRNCTFIGRNHYGAISTEYSGNQATTTLTLENVTYSGPQAVYNRHGTVEIIGGSYDIGKLNETSSAVNEFIEANTVILSGAINVHHDGTPNSCFFMTEANPSFTIKAGAILNADVESRELIYTDNPVSFLMEANSTLNARCNWSMFYNSGMSANSFIMQEGANLVYEQKSARGAPTIHCSGNLTVSPFARLIIIKKEFSSAEPLIRFSQTATATFNNPQSVVLYNPGGKTITWSGGTGTVNIDAQIINYWLIATAFPDAGSFDDQPLYNWEKADGSNATINATLSNSSMTSVNTNLTAGVDAPIIPTTSSFNLHTARVLSFGSLPLSVEQPHESDNFIVGESVSGANMRATINDSERYNSIDYFGAYSIRVEPPLEKNDSILIEANYDFKTKSQLISADGVLEMTIPEQLPFVRVASPTRHTLYPRTNTNWSIVVRDSRTNGSDWTLSAHASLPLSSQTAQLNDALVFKQGETIESIEGSSPLQIYLGQGNTDPDYTETVITWAQIEGLLMRLAPNTIYQSGQYQTEITFTLDEVSPP